MKELFTKTANFIMKYVSITAALIFFWLAFVQTFGNNLCDDISTCYAIVIFLVGIILTLKIRILEEEHKGLELVFFITGTILNIVFIISAFALDCNENNNKKALLVLNGAIWWNFIISMRNRNIQFYRTCPTA